MADTDKVILSYPENYECNRHIMVAELHRLGIEATLVGDYEEIDYAGIIVSASDEREAIAALDALMKPLRLSEALAEGRSIACRECEADGMAVDRHPEGSILSWLFYTLRNGTPRARLICRLCGKDRWVDW